MADPPSPTRAQIPSAIAASKPNAPDAFHPVDTSTPANGQGPSHHDYTENAPQAVVDAIAIERAREEKEAPPDMMVGSLQSWMGQNDGESLRIRGEDLELMNRWRYIPLFNHQNTTQAWIQTSFYRLEKIGLVWPQSFRIIHASIGISGRTSKRLTITFFRCILRRFRG